MKYSFSNELTHTRRSAILDRFRTLTAVNGRNYTSYGGIGAADSPLLRAATCWKNRNRCFFSYWPHSEALCTEPGTIERELVHPVSSRVSAVLPRRSRPQSQNRFRFECSVAKTICEMSATIRSAHKGRSGLSSKARTGEPTGIFRSLGPRSSRSLPGTSPTVPARHNAAVFESVFPSAGTVPVRGYVTSYWLVNQ